MFKLGQRVVIVADTFEQNLPIGEYGYIIAYDRNADNAFDYVVRLPKSNKNVYVPAADIELEETLLAREAERIEREALIDFALATRNEALFRRIVSGPKTEAEDNGSKEVQSTEDFIKQINLRAWI
ncbi:ATPase [Paenibacillus thermoaerophilus]|uniref:ATPase n=1 Tax=Paenibacillus thermoaerophilus TaxID=1215385 RepID=A0ABW2V4E4_9BACL|nr:ATPase [Paenibacillus thermoaerophilus]TMV16109.1 ATPase [Paenibacillus thermoaerophilus]